MKAIIKLRVSELLCVVVAASVGLMMFAIDLSAQEWQFVSGQYFGAAYGDEGTVLVVGERGIIMRSSDDGKSWTMPKSSTYETLRDVVLSDNGTVVAVGDNGTALRSEDAGETWKSIDLHTDSTLLFISFPTPDHGYIGGAGGIFYRSDDGGESWSALPNLPEPAAAVQFVDVQSGVMTTSTGRIYQTMNGGQEWKKVYEDTARPLSGIDFTPDGGFGLVGGSGGILLRTRDSGKTWSEGFVDFPLFGGKIAVEADGRVVVGGPYEGSASTGLARSQDSGRTWSAVSLPLSYTLFAVQGMALRGDGHGVVGSNTGSIYRTEDGWETPRIVSELRHEYPFYGVASFTRSAFATASVGVLPNDLFPGGYVRTSDGGITWMASNFGPDFYSSPQFYSETGGVMVRRQPRLLVRTTDAGATWKGATATIDPPTLGGDVNRMIFLDSLRGFQIGSALSGDIYHGTFFRTVDGGKTLRGMEFDAVQVITRMDFVSPEAGWIAGSRNPDSLDSLNHYYYYGYIYRTRDGGEHWEEIYSRYGVYAQPQMLRFRNEREGYICVGGDDYGYAGKFVLLKTEDAGDTWGVSSVFDQAVNDMVFFSDQLWYAVGNSASIWMTTDAGEHWRKEPITPVPRTSFGYPISFRSIALLPDERTVIITGSGAVVRRVFPQKVTGVEEERERSREMEGLTLIPNPTSGAVRVHFKRAGGAGAGLMKLAIYDAVGAEVVSKEIAFEGLQDVDLDLSTLSSGVYRVVVEDGRLYELGSSPLLIVR